MTSNQETFMNPYTDFGFKKLFGTEPNKDLLISFLNAVFQGRRPTIVDLHYLNTEVLGPYYGGRNSVFDVYCSTKGGGHFIVEMQRSDQPYFKDRTVYYASAAVVKNICYLMEQPKELQEKVFTKFFQEAKIGMFTPDERFAYEQSQMHYWDNLNTINYSYDKGVAAGKKEGKEEGREEATRELVQKMLAMGMSKETIFELTGVAEIPTEE